MKKLAFVLLLNLLSAYSFAQGGLPDVVLIDYNGNEVHSSALSKGKPFAICFWAVWNKSSLLELNNLMENYKDWHDQSGIDLYALSIDEKQRIPRAKAYVEAHDWKFNVLFDVAGKLENSMNINGVPHLMLFNSEGQIVWQEHSYHSGLDKAFLEEVHKLK